MQILDTTGMMKHLKGMDVLLRIGIQVRKLFVALSAHKRGINVRLFDQVWAM